MAGVAALSKALPAHDEEGKPLLVIGLESTIGLSGADGEDYVWIITDDGSIETRKSATITVDWVFVPVEGEAISPDQPEGVSGQLPDPE